MLELAEIIAFVFGIVALGYIAGWTGLLRLTTGDALTEFAVAVALPALLFRTMISIDLKGAMPWAIWGAYFSVIPIIWIMGHLTITRFFGRERPVGVVGGIASSFSNMLLLGFPLLTNVYGQAGLDVLSLLISIHLPIMLAASIITFEWARGGDVASISAAGIAREFFRKLLSNPLIIGILCGIAWRASGLPLPSLGTRFVDAFAGIAGTIALFGMGMGLRKYGVGGNVKPALATAALKLIAMPALALGTAWLAGLPPVTAQVVVIVAAMPTGVNPYLIASRFGAGQMLASNTMTISTVGAVATTIFWLAVAQAVF
ncbi:AEC family transporter [Aquamicrobium zhengzhouense]|uniref:AEC family transporter n=1 Tax=Aquamicrobium zhengzhouense TaxID=2781738 RepID=A0ABS0S7U4_9HYPH|nr:AEC family transporter [Aquamicrobium zhengzhouense]MBI1619354.1 AEC family transporter [Aquamicrobium zhengzhouense]